MNEGLRKSYNRNDIVKSLKLMYLSHKFKIIYYLHIHLKNNCNFFSAIL